MRLNIKKIFELMLFVTSRLWGLVIQLVSLPVLSERLGAGGFGAIAYSQAIANVAVSAIDMGYSISGAKSFIDADNPKEKAKVFCTVLLNKLIMGLGLVVVIFLYLAYEDDRLIRIAVLNSIIFLMASIVSPLWYMQANGVVGYYYFFTQTVRTIGIIFLYFFVKSKDDFALAAFIVFSTEFLSAIFLFFESIRKLDHGFVMPDSSLMKKLFFLSLKNWGGGLGSIAFSALLPIFIKHQMDVAAVGLYSSAEKIVRAAHACIWPIGQIFYSRAVIFWKDNDNHLHDGVFRAIFAPLILMMIIGFGSALFIYLFDDYLIKALYGETFPGAVDCLRVMMFYPFVSSMEISVLYFFIYPRSMIKALFFGYWGGGFLMLLYLLVSPIAFAYYSAALPLYEVVVLSIFLFFLTFDRVGKRNE